MMDLQNIFETAQNLVKRIRPLALEYANKQVSIQRKADFSPVTEVDKQIEETLRTALLDYFPDMDVLGEEFGQASKESEYLWIIDPIDGTRSFARGIPIYGIQLALTRAGESLIGILDYPALNENLAAAKGLGCYWQGKPCQVSEIRSLESAMVYLHEPDWLQKHHPELFDYLTQAEKWRNWGDGYSFALAISGRVELALDPRLDIWDAAPLPILVTEAGGKFVNWEGKTDFRQGSAILGNPYWVEQALDLIRHQK